MMYHMFKLAVCWLLIFLSGASWSEKIPEKPTSVYLTQLSNHVESHIKWLSEYTQIALDGTSSAHSNYAQQLISQAFEYCDVHEKLKQKKISELSETMQRFVMRQACLDFLPVFEKPLTQYTESDKNIMRKNKTNFDASVLGFLSPKGVKEYKRDPEAFVQRMAHDVLVMTITSLIESR